MAQAAIRIAPTSTVWRCRVRCRDDVRIEAMPIKSIAALVLAAVALTSAVAGAQSGEPTHGTPAKVPTFHHGFAGARLARSNAGVTFDGSAFVRVKCPGGTFGFCYGSITLFAGSTRLASAPLGLRSNDAPAVRVPLKGSARVRARRGLSATARIVSEDGLGRKVTRRQRLRLHRG
jgi:hypothetical protein